MRILCTYCGDMIRRILGDGGVGFGVVTITTVSGLEVLRFTCCLFVVARDIFAQASVAGLPITAFELRKRTCPACLRDSVTYLGGIGYAAPL